MTKRALLRTLERERMAHAEHVNQLLTTICGLVGNPDAAPIQRPAEPVEVIERGRWIATPEQLPD